MKKNLIFPLFLFVIVLLIFLLYILYQGSNNIDSDALIGFLGTIIGALVVMLSNILSGFLVRENQLRLAAIERRLAAHQDAYALWRKLGGSLFDDSINNTILECQDWWNKNCLYLSPKAREAFRRAYFEAQNYRHLLKTQNYGIIDKSYKDIMRAGDLIVQGAGLPPLNDQEDKKSTP